MPMYTGWGEKL